MYLICEEIPWPTCIFPLPSWQEVAATSALKASAEFTRLIPSLIVLIGYGVAFYFMALVLRTIPVRHYLCNLGAD